MRDRFLRTLVVLGAAVWFITELLSGFDAIRRAPLIVCWIVVIAAAVILAKGSRQREKRSHVNAARRGPGGAPCATNRGSI